jgi:hypothetical protein
LILYCRPLSICIFCNLPPTDFVSDSSKEEIDPYIKNYKRPPPAPATTADALKNPDRVKKKVSYVLPWCE